jgi:hypothetical protein
MGGLVKKGPAFKHKRGFQSTPKPWGGQDPIALMIGDRLAIPANLLMANRKFVKSLIAELADRGLQVVHHETGKIIVKVTKQNLYQKLGYDRASFAITNSQDSTVIWAQKTGDNRFTKIY